MDEDAPLPPPLSFEEMEAQLRRSEADVAAGRVVSADAVLRRMQAAIDRIEARQRSRIPART